MLKVERFINELMSSNCYLVFDDVHRHCIVIDPASELSLCEIDFIEQHGLTLDYIILTHEHTDHTWGVNALIAKYPNTKVVCSSACAQELPNAGDMYFQLYFDRENYSYRVGRVDIEVGENTESLWLGHTIKYIMTPGHSIGSMCVEIDGHLFTGDTIMPYKPTRIRDKELAELYQKSINTIQTTYTPSTIVHPGHGESGRLGEMIL